VTSGNTNLARPLMSAAIYDIPMALWL